jgi:ParB family chromosome partitioning protein
VPKLVTVDQLCISPFNVRLNAEDAESTSALQASIATRGLLLPLVVHDMAPYRDQALPNEPEAAWGVLAGGRRLRAIRSLIQAGTIRSDFRIEIVTRDLSPAEITELSLAENLLRRQLRPYEIYSAIARAADQGADENEIAANIGQRLEWVRRQLRLGRLVPDIFRAYADGFISEEQAQAFAATEDKELQRAAWTHFSALKPWDREPHRIRAWYKIGDRELDRLLRFVGAEAYRASGGRFELDLFADGPERGRVVDEGQLREMAENRLAKIRMDLRRRTSRTDLRFVNEPPQHLGTTDHSLEIVPVTGRGKSLPLPAGDVVATLTINQDGKQEERFWWTSRKAKREGTRQTPAEAKAPAASVVTPGGSTLKGAEAFDRYSANSQAARAAVKDEHGLTADGLQVMRSVRRELLRALLVADAVEGGTLGRDYLVWAQLRQELGKSVRDADVGARGVVSVWQSREDAEPKDVVAPHLEETNAHKLWAAALANMSAQSFITIEDPSDAFTAYHFASDKLKAAAAAVMAGLSLLRSANVPGWRIATHDRLADILGANDDALRELWAPTSQFMALFPRLKRLELAQPHVDQDAFRDWYKLSDATLTGATAGAVDQVPGWVHPLLSFGVASEHDSAEQREAAE